ELQRHVDAPVVLAGDLPLAQQRQRLARGEVGTAGLVEQAVELVADAGQLEPRQHGIERIEHRGGLLCACHQKDPPAIASYSASGRRSAGKDCGGGSCVGSACARTGWPPTPATPARCRASMTRWRRPSTTACTATSCEPWRTRTCPPATITSTCSPISR